MGLMNKDLEVVTHAVSPMAQASLLAARFCGRAHKRSLKRLQLQILTPRPGRFFSLKTGSIAGPQFRVLTRSTCD